MSSEPENTPTAVLRPAGIAYIHVIRKGWEYRALEQFLPGILDCAHKAFSKQGEIFTPLVEDGFFVLFPGEPGFWKNLCGLQSCLEFGENLRRLLPDLPHPPRIALHQGSIYLQDNPTSPVTLGASLTLAKNLARSLPKDEVGVSETYLGGLKKDLRPDWQWQVAKNGESTTGVLRLSRKGVDHFQLTPAFEMKTKTSGEAYGIYAAAWVQPPEASLFDSPETADKANLLGKYRLVKKLGEGGAGEVWQGLDPFGNAVAVKTLLEKPGTVSEALRLFLQEGQIMSKLHHRGICRVLEVGRQKEINYIAMEFVEGVSLADVLSAPHEEQPLDLRQATARLHTADKEVEKPTGETYNRVLESQAILLLKQLCEAVHFAHERGVLHRDIKPHNILLRLDGEPILTDFGIAKTMGKTASQGESGGRKKVFGTIEYMSPEQASSRRDVNERADVYSLGAVLYLMLTGRKHFVSSGHLPRDIKKLQTHHPVDPGFYAPQLPLELRAIALKALQAQPEKRYANARQLYEDLERFQNGEPISARNLTLSHRIRKRIGRHRTAVSWGAALILLMASFFAYWYADRHKTSGTWIPLYQKDFTRDLDLESVLSFRDSRNRQPVPPFPQWENGLQPRPGQWCWLKGLENDKLHESVRVRLHLVYRHYPEYLAVILNGKPEPVTDPADRPPGYAFILGQHRGAANRIIKEEEDHRVTLVQSAPNRVRGNKRLVLELERNRDRLTFRLDGVEQVSGLDYFPFRARHFKHIGFVTLSPDVYITSIEVARLSLPEKASPVIAAEALESNQNIEEAYRELQVIAEDYKNTPVAHQALIKSYRLILENPAQLGEHLDSLEAQLERNLPRFKSQQEYWAIKTIHAWRSGAPQASRKMLFDFQKKFPDADLSHLLLPQSSLPGRWASYLDYLAVTPGEKDLTLPPGLALSPGALQGIALKGLSSPAQGWRELELLKDAPLEILDAGHNKISRLAPLRGKSLTHLFAGYNLLTSVKSLSGLPLQVLELPHNQVTRLDGLEESPLAVLDVSHNFIKDITPLQSLPLIRLQASHNQIQTLSPLGRTNLVSLDVSHNELTDPGGLPLAQLRELNLSDNPLKQLKGLEKSKISHLTLARVPLTTLVSLKGLPLEALDLSGNPQLPWEELNMLAAVRLNLSGCGISVLPRMYSQDLRTLVLDFNNLTQLDALAPLKLRHLSLRENRVRDLRPLKQMPLQYLDVENNPGLASLPLPDPLPDTLKFYGTSIDPGYVMGRLRRQKSPSGEYSLRYARILNYIRSGNVFGLKRLGVSQNGSVYLHIPMAVTYEEADRMSRSWGGHLVTFNSREEERFVLLHMMEIQRAWMGLRKSEDQWSWQNGEPLTYANPSHPENADENTLLLGIRRQRWEWMPPSKGEKTGWIVEWSRKP